MNDSSNCCSQYISHYCISEVVSYVSFPVITMIIHVIVAVVAIASHNCTCM